MASDLTEARPERVRSLWPRKDRDITQISIDEGYAATSPKTPDAIRKQLVAMIVQVGRDRVFWRQTWRKAKALTSEDAHETRGEYLATLSAYRDIGLEIAADPKERG